MTKIMDFLVQIQQFFNEANKTTANIYCVCVFCNKPIVNDLKLNKTL